MGASDVKELAGRYRPEEIEACIRDEVSTGENTCTTAARHQAMLDDLARAEVVRELMETGISLHDALREVARRIRELGKGGSL